MNRQLVPMEIEEPRHHSHSVNFVGGAGRSGAAVSAIQQARGRRWTTQGEDMLTDRPSNSQRFWAAMGMRQQPLLLPVSSRFTDANRASNLTGIDPAFLSPGDGLHHSSIHLSSRLPRSVWIILAKCLGIKLSPTDKPILATVLHIITLAAAMTFAIPGGWYMVFDIHSKFSRTTVIIGSVQIIIGLAWACLGVYSHNLAGRLFQNRNFVECVRAHSKTFLKISTTWLTFFLGVGVVAVNCYGSFHIFYDDTCSTAQIETLVCQVFFVGRVIYAVLTLLWNFIVTYVLFSVCRTHTIGIRQLMRELSMDARLFENYCLQHYHIQRDDSLRESINTNVGESWYLWDDVTNGTGSREEESLTSSGVFLKSISVSSLRRLSGHLHRHRNASIIMESGEEVRGGGAGEHDDGDRGGRLSQEEAVETVADRKTRMSINDDESENGGDDHRDEILQCGEGKRRNSALSLLTNEDLLFTYWKFVRRLSVTSRYLQRWLASWIAFVIMWNGYFIIFWTSHSASLVDIVQFVVPLLILLLVCSAYSEVNSEGQRLLRTICPLEERLAVVYYFHQSPLIITVFSIPVTYNAMVTVILAFSVAFASKMILDELNTH